MSDKPLAIAKFHRRRTFHTDPGGEHVELRVYEGQENLHIDGEYAIYRRTAEPGLADLASVDRAVRKESYEWGVAHGRNETVELEAIVRDLAASNPVGEVHVDWDETVAECTQCGSRMPGEDEGIEHLDDCAFARSRAWVSAHPVSGDPA